MSDGDGVPWLVAETLYLLTIPIKIRRLGARVVEIRVGERHDVGDLRNPRLQVICGEVEDDAPRVPKHPYKSERHVAALDARAAHVAAHLQRFVLVEHGVVLPFALVERDRDVLLAQVERFARRGGGERRLAEAAPWATAARALR